MSEDTYKGKVIDPLSLNLYAYCWNNPVMYTDPSGHHWYFLWADDYLENVWDAAKARTNEMMENPNWYNIGNWLSIGTFDMVKGTFKPEKPLSLEHWLDSFGTATLIFGFYKSGTTYIVSAKGAAKSGIYIVDDLSSLPRIGSATKLDKYHAFSDIVDNYSSLATKTSIKNGTLYQLEGSLNGVAGRFEWIVQNGSVTHRMFIPGGKLNGVPIKP